MNKETQSHALNKLPSIQCENSKIHNIYHGNQVIL